MPITSEQYHSKTSYIRHEISPHYLDWENQPDVFKRYPGVDALPLPHSQTLPEFPLSSLLFDTHPIRGAINEVRDLSSILRLTCTLTAKGRQGGSDFFFRSAASAGALYPTEIYVATPELNGLKAGLYHFALARHGLHRLRSVDPSSEVQTALHPQPALTPRLSFFLTGIFFRSAWKYRDRAYRYVLMDAGHVLENLILALTAMNVSFFVNYDFDDPILNQLLGLDSRREAALAVCYVPNGPLPQGQKELNPLPRGFQEASRVAEREVEYPVLQDVHRSGFGMTARSPNRHMLDHLRIPSQKWKEIHTKSPDTEHLIYKDALFHRRSRRNFTRDAVSQSTLFYLLKCLSDQALSAGSGNQTPSRFVSLCFLVERVAGLDPGMYLMELSASRYTLIRPGHFIESMARICLEQLWLANAAVHFIFLSNPVKLDEIGGARGYRYAMMTAGRLGQRLYLGATTLGLGCCGIGAFYDEEASRLLDLPDSARMLYLVGVGPVKRI